MACGILMILDRIFKMLNLSLIVAKDKKNGIGIENKLPWHLKKELRYFKEITTKKEDPKKQNALIMGKKTWESLPKKPLPDRVNVVLSQRVIALEHAHVFPSLTKALVFLSDTRIENVFIIGGSRVFQSCLALPELKTLYITQIDKDFVCDCYFPDIPQVFQLKNETWDEENGIRFSFQIWEKT